MSVQHILTQVKTISLSVLMVQVKASNGFTCDGGYIKLLQEDSGKNLAKFDNDARYTIMFGPDRCGTTDKVCFIRMPEFFVRGQESYLENLQVHFILQHLNPVSKKWEEKVHLVNI